MPTAMAHRSTMLQAARTSSAPTAAVSVMQLRLLILQISLSMLEESAKPSKEREMIEPTSLCLVCRQTSFKGICINGISL